MYEREYVAQSGVAELGADDRIVRFVEKPGPGETASHWVSTGIVVAGPRLLDAIPRGAPSDLGRDIFPRLLDDSRGVYAYRMTGGHWWFDRVEEYEAARTDAKLAAFLRRGGPR